MKIKSGFLLRKIAEQWVVVPVGARNVEFNAIMTLSETGADIWKALEQDMNEEQIVSNIIKEYEVDEETAKNDVKEYIQQLLHKGIIE